MFVVVLFIIFTFDGIYGYVCNDQLCIINDDLISNDDSITCGNNVSYCEITCNGICNKRQIHSSAMNTKLIVNSDYVINALTLNCYNKSISSACTIICSNNNYCNNIDFNCLSKNCVASKPQIIYDTIPESDIALIYGLPANIFYLIMISLVTGLCFCCLFVMSGVIIYHRLKRMVALHSTKSSLKSEITLSSKKNKNNKNNNGYRTQSISKSTRASQSIPKTTSTSTSDEYNTSETTPRHTGETMNYHQHNTTMNNKSIIIMNGNSLALKSKTINNSHTNSHNTDRDSQIKSSEQKYESLNSRDSVKSSHNESSTSIIMSNDTNDDNIMSSYQDTSNTRINSLQKEWRNINKPHYHTKTNTRINFSLTTPYTPSNVPGPNTPNNYSHRLSIDNYNHNNAKSPISPSLNISYVPQTNKTSKNVISFVQPQSMLNKTKNPSLHDSMDDGAILVYKDDDEHSSREPSINNDK